MASPVKFDCLLPYTYAEVFLEGLQNHVKLDFTSANATLISHEKLTVSQNHIIRRVPEDQMLKGFVRTTEPSTAKHLSFYILKT